MQKHHKYTNPSPWTKGYINIPQTRYNLHKTKFRKNFKAIATKRLLAQCIVKKLSMNHIYDDEGKKLTINKLLLQDDVTDKRIPSFSNEWEHLAQGNDVGVSSTDTIKFFSFASIPNNNKITYVTSACNHRPLKEEPLKI